MQRSQLKEALDFFLLRGGDDSVACGHEQIWVADARKIKMNLSEIRKLYKDGWFIDEESWSHFL